MRLSRIVRSVTVLIITTLLFNTPAFAANKPDAATMKAKIVARGEGQDVRVTLADKTQVKGFIVSIHDQNFILKEKGPGEPRTIDYTQVIGVHRAHMSTPAKIAIGVGIGFAVLIGASAAVFAAS